MRRIAATFGQDVQIQARNGFYAAAAFVLLSWAVILSQVPAAQLGRFMPVLLMGNILIGSFYFVGGLALLERAEGSLLARAVTPLRPTEYLLARVASLSLLALAENLVLTLLFVGGVASLLPLAAGIALCAALFTLAGFITVVRYDSINSYLLPSIVISGLISMPMMVGATEWRGWPLYLHPLQPALVLLEGAFRPLAGWEIAYAIGYGALSGLVLLAWAARAYRRLVAEL